MTEVLVLLGFLVVVVGYAVAGYFVARWDARDSWRSVYAGTAFKRRRETDEEYVRRWFVQAWIFWPGMLAHYAVAVARRQVSDRLIAPAITAADPRATERRVAELEAEINRLRRIGEDAC